MTQTVTKNKLPTITTLALLCWSFSLISCGGKSDAGEAEKPDLQPVPVRNVTQEPKPPKPEPIPGEAFLSLNDDGIVYLSALPISFLPQGFRDRFVELRQRYRLALDNLPSPDDLIQASPAYAGIEELRNQIQILKVELEQNKGRPVSATPEISGLVSRISKLERELESSESEVDKIFSQLLESKKSELGALESDYENTQQLNEDLKNLHQRLKERRQKVEDEYQSLLEHEKELKEDALVILKQGIDDISNNPDRVERDNPRFMDDFRPIDYLTYSGPIEFLKIQIDLGTINPFLTFWRSGVDFQTQQYMFEYRIRTIEYGELDNVGDALYFTYVPASMKRKFVSQFLKSYNEWTKLREKIDIFEGRTGKIASIERDGEIEISEWEDAHGIKSDELKVQWTSIQGDYQNKRPELVAFLEDKEEQGERKTSMLAAYHKKKEHALRELKAERERLEKKTRLEYEQQRLNKIEELDGKRYSLESQVFQKANIDWATSVVELKNKCYEEFKKLVVEMRTSEEITGSRGDFIMPPETAYLFAEKSWSKGEHLVWLLPVRKRISKMILSLPNAIRLKEENNRSWVIEYLFEGETGETGAESGAGEQTRMEALSDPAFPDLASVKPEMINGNFEEMKGEVWLRWLAKHMAEVSSRGAVFARLFELKTWGTDCPELKINYPSFNAFSELLGNPDRVEELPDILRWFYHCKDGWVVVILDKSDNNDDPVNGLARFCPEGGEKGILFKMGLDIGEDSPIYPAKPTCSSIFEWTASVRNNFGWNQGLPLPGNTSVASFKSTMGEPDKTQSVGDYTYWYYSCSDGMIQIVLDTPVLSYYGAMTGSFNTY